MGGFVVGQPVVTTSTSCGGVQIAAYLSQLVAGPQVNLFPVSTNEVKSRNRIKRQKVDLSNEAIRYYRQHACRCGPLALI